MEIKIIKLNGSDFLELSIDDSQHQWTRVFLVTASGRTRLGADIYSIIHAKLKAALQPLNAADFAGQIDKIPVVNILNFSENHYSLYMGKDDNSRSVLFFSNSEGVLTNSLVLDINILEKELNC
jgi:hypothetical protein